MHFLHLLTITACALSGASALTMKRDLGDAQKRSLEAHNKARAEVKTGGPRPPLEWDIGLERAAKNYAKKLAQADTTNKPKLTHDADRGNQGENLGWSMGVDDAMMASTQMWINEKKDYTCGRTVRSYQGNPKAVGHYTQVIWPDTTKVGIAMEKAADGSWFVVARYSKPGNFLDKAAC